METVAAWLSLALFLGFAFAPFRDLLGRLSKRTGDWTVAFLLLPYLLAVELRLSAWDLLWFAFYLALPTLLLRFRPRRARPFDLFHALTILAIWVPLETDLFALGLQLLKPGLDLGGLLSGPDLLPAVKATMVPGVRLPIHTLTGASLTLFLFLVRHPLEGIGYTFRLGWRDLRDALAGLLGFALVGLPLGLAMGFLGLQPAAPSLPQLVVGIVGGYLFVALIEEMLFRGVIQNLLGERLRHWELAPLVSAVVFGLAHLNNSTRGFPKPNWPYVVMATLAGLAYGWVWRRTHKVTASAITHALVNLMWGIFFP
jgi:membrane protease YdiL (CAAX protease family)